MANRTLQQRLTDGVEQESLWRAPWLLVKLVIEYLLAAAIPAIVLLILALFTDKFTLAFTLSANSYIPATAGAAVPFLNATWCTMTGSN